MQKQISKKIFLYLFIFLFLGTPNNKMLLELSIKDSNGFEILSLSKFDDIEIVRELSNHKHENLFLLEKEKIKKIIKKNKIIENYNIYKKYPSDLVVNFEKTELLAVTQMDGVNFYIGSNGNLIEVKNVEIDLPMIFGNFDLVEFLKLKDLIDESFFDFYDIKNLYYYKSKRWDIETKNGLLVKLPVNDLSESFRVFIKIINDTKLQNIQMIDLRQNNQVIING
jgi:cell division protein FtsQ